MEREEAAMPFTAPEGGPRSAIAEVVARNAARLAAIDGVHGVGEGRTATGEPAIRVDVEHPGVGERLPAEIEGIPVEVVVVPGGFEAQPA